MANAKSSADASEQLKQGLRWIVRNRFWLIVAVSALLPVVGYAMGAGAVQEATKKLVSDIKGADSGVAPYASGDVPNDQWKPLVEEKTEVLSKDINKAWARLYEVQAPLLKWPEVVQDRFPAWGRKWPENVDAGAVQKAIDDYVNAYEKEVDATYAKVNPWDYQTGKGVVVVPDKMVLLRPSIFDPANPPTLNQVWSAQERLWIQGTLLDAVAKVNGKAKDWDGAVVKQIDLVEVGSPMAQDQKSLVEGKTVEPVEEIVPPGGTPAAAAAEGSAAGGPAVPGGMPGMGSGSGMMGAGAVPQDVYRLKTDSTQYFIVPVSMSVLVDQNRLQDFLVGLENSPMAIQVSEFEMLKPVNPVTKPEQGVPVAGLGMGMMGMGSGMMGMMGSGRGMMGSGMMRGPGGMMPPGVDPRGMMGGMAPGRMPGMDPRGMMGGSSTAKRGTDVRKDDREKKRTERDEKRKALGRAVDTYYDIVQVTVFGQARFYNPPPPPPAVEPSAGDSPGQPAADASKSEEKPGEPKAGDASKTGEANPAAPAAEPKVDEPKAAPGAEPKKDETTPAPAEPAKADPKADAPAKDEAKAADPAKAEPKAEAKPAEPSKAEAKPADMPKS